MNQKKDPTKRTESLQELLETPSTTEATETWIDPTNEDARQAEAQKDALKKGDPNWPEAGN